VAGLETIIALRSLAGDRVHLTLLDPAEDFAYKPLSVGEPFAHRSAEHRPLTQIASDFDVELRADTVARVDPAAATVQTAGGEEIGYDSLVVALGARREPAYEHARTFRGHEDSEALHGLVQDLEEGYVKSVVFIVPPGAAWSLPLYELALMTAARAHDMSAEVELTVVTPEAAPLEVFGDEASQYVQGLLEAAGIVLETAAYADVEQSGKVFLRPSHRTIETQRIVALPVLTGMTPPGLPADERGFAPIDPHCRVPGLENVYAAGDGTQFPLKQGGVATQQADVIAATIAQAVGVQVEPHVFRPVLRAKLLTGGKEHFLRSEVTGGRGATSEAGEQALWWPPSKIAGAYLAPYLAGAGEEPPPDRAGLELEVPFDRTVA
jgi:sulfide:quinone oxidoreductase